MYRLALARACQRLKITLYFCLTKEAPACLHPNVAPALKMDRNLRPIPWEHILFGLPSLHQILSCLLLHPIEWDRKTHFGELACGHACDCCRSRWMFFFEAGDGCDPCRTAWLLSTVCKNMLHHLQKFNATCSCGNCSKSWLSMGWRCPRNPWKGCYRARGWFFCRCLAGQCPPEEESPYAANATPESQEAHSPRMSPVSYPSPITYSLDEEEESSEEQHEEEQGLA